MKKVFIRIFIALALLLLIAAWLLIGPGTGFSQKIYYLEIPTGSSYESVMKQAESTRFVRFPSIFNLLAKQLDYPQKVKAGRYAIKKGSSLVSILRKLRNGQQEPVNLVITKLRTKEDFAALAGKKFEFDSAVFIHFLLSNDSLQKYALDSNTIMAGVLPDTYTYFWNTTPAKVMDKIMSAKKAFWTADRITLSQARGYTPEQIVTIASIVEEETNKNEEKGNIASVYINRLNKGMRLGADPTVKFALRDFGLKRIYNKHLAVESPYNTYRVTGLPPGPICTPQRQTIDAVLNAPSTNYLYFVAKPDFSGYHVFAETYQQHLQYAKNYQVALDSLIRHKNHPEETGN
jgi:UPF0755 protein